MNEDTKVVASPEELDSGLVEVAAEVLSLLSDATRIRIVKALQGCELTVNELAKLVGKRPATVSQHLAKLRWAKAVQARHDGNRVFYTLVDEHLLALVNQALMQAEHVLSAAPSHHKEG
ncbi:MAG: metalloregulator ArsR/SmtB family transcription factor [Propionibacteriaceae bacterium]|jgi:DNA-binding transcriptional ArsR family regulator|nr:metalloregulator ArsR/SmtB family transcription factor [Propionibacteriaceae bacterium]